MSARLLLAALSGACVTLLWLRAQARRRRDYVRLIVRPYRTDRGRAATLVGALDTLHGLLRRRRWRRVLAGQPSLALELHVGDGPRATLAIVVPAELARVAEATLRGAYPNLALQPAAAQRSVPPSLLRLRKRRSFIERIAVVDPDTLEDPPADRILTVMAAAGRGPALVQLTLTPAPVWFERIARRLHERRERAGAENPSQVARAELVGGLELQHRPLFFGDIRVGAADRGACLSIAAELRAGHGENRLTERVLGGHGRTLRRRVRDGEAGPLPDLRRGVYASSEIAALWQLPSVGFARVPIARGAIPVAPAPPAILRPRGAGLLRDALGPVTIHPQLRRQNTAVVGAVDQGKTSVTVASVAEDLRRPRCAVILLDPKGDAADAALAAVPDGRTCTLLDLAEPTCGFNPLAVRAAPDAIADAVVAALRQLFGEGDIRASSDRYLRNAIIAALAYERQATLWDVARLLAVTDEGHRYRERVAASLLAAPEYAEVAAFFDAELGAQLADARAATTAKLDAPANKLARVLNSASIKRVLLNDSLRLDIDAVIDGAEVLVVKGALGEAGASNVSVLMQLILGAIDAALSRQQDRRSADARVTVALKIDEAPLVINAAFAQTLALKRSAGLETVASWQTDSQWEPELREQLDALFAHRVYFATASAQDARSAAAAMLDEYSDQLRAGHGSGGQIADPDVRLHLPRHHALVSWTTPEGRQRPFVARTIPFRADPRRLAQLAARQHDRGGRPLTSFERPHWDRPRQPPAPPSPGWEEPSLPAQPPAPREPSLPAQPPAPREPSLPGQPPAPQHPSLAELRALDVAASGRIVVAAGSARLPPGADDLALLEWLAAAGWALTTQIHRRFNPDRALTTTQRRIKRLADAGLIQRVQLHGGDGGGIPMCCAIAEPGRALLDERALPPAPRLRAGADGRLDPAALALLGRRVHLLGWLLALETAAGDALVSVRGPRRFRLEPPAARSGRSGDLRLPAGRTPADFPPGPAGAVTPLAAAELDCAGGGREQLLIDFAHGPVPASLLERYDQMLSGWWSAARGTPPPLCVFVCSEASAVQEACTTAAAALRAAHAYAGEDAAAWPRPGRERVRFADEADLHAGRMRAWRVPPVGSGGSAVAVELAAPLATGGGARARWH